MGQNSSSPRNRGRSLDTVPRSQNNSTSPNRSRLSPPPIVQQPSSHNFAFQPLTQDQRSHLMNILPSAVVIEPSQPLHLPQRRRVITLERRDINVNHANEVDDFTTMFLNIKELNRAVDFSQKMLELKLMEKNSADIHRDPFLTFNLGEIENNLRSNPMDFNEQLALATDFNSFSSKYMTMVETYDETRDKVAERKVLEDGRTRKRVTNTQAYRKISAGDISLREVAYNGNSNTQLHNQSVGNIISSRGEKSSSDLSQARIIKTTQLRPAPLTNESRNYQENILEHNTSINQGIMDSRRGSQRTEDQNMKSYENNKFINPVLNSHNSSLSSIPNRKTSAFAQNKDKNVPNISNINIDLSPSLTSLDQLAQQVSSKNSPKSRGEKDSNNSLTTARKNAPVMTPRGSNHTIPQRNPVYSPKRSEVTSPERRQEEHNFFASLVGQKPVSRKMTKEPEVQEEKSINLGQGKGYIGQIMKSPPPRTSGRYGQKTQYFQHVFKNNANVSPKAQWEEEKTSVGNARSLRDVDETWETRETQNKASTSIISQRKEKLAEKSFNAGQRSPARAANLNDSSSSISKTKQGKISTVPMKTKTGKNPSEQTIPTKKFDLSGTHSKKLNKSQLEEKKSPNISQIRERPHPEVLILPSGSEKETSRLDQTRSDKQFSERSDSEVMPKTEAEQDFQQPLEATLDLSAFVIPRTGNNTNKAADNYPGFDDDFFKENPFQVQQKKSSGKSDGAENNRSQYGRQGGGAEDLNKSATSSRGHNNNSKMMPQKNKEKVQMNKENMGSSKNIDVSETSLDNIDDQELISEVREKLWSLSNKLQSALNSKHARENDFVQPKSGLSPRNPNLENQRKIIREEHVQNLKFSPYQNDIFFSDEQARSPVTRR